MEVSSKMFICSVTLILVNFLQIINAKDTLEKSVSVEAAVAALVEIKPSQALPLVLFEEPQFANNTILPVRHILQIPKSMIRAVTQNRRMINETTFSNSTGRHRQIFFCPNENEENCLVPQTFKDSEPLQCNKEPIPLTYAKSEQNPCGSESTGATHYIYYNICPGKEPYKYVTTEIQFYEFCYDWKKKNTLHTFHIISSPLLFTTNLLLREREVTYPITINDEFKPSIFNATEDTVIPQLDLFIHPEKLAYKLQMLVPDTDMAMALWRKTTYRNFNLAWQHEKLIPLWDKINRYVRSHAEQQFQYGNRVLVRTGIFDINEKSINDVQLSNTWVKIVSVVRPDEETNSSVVILMNNFIHSVASTSEKDVSTQFLNHAESDNSARSLHQKKIYNSTTSLNQSEDYDSATSINQIEKDDATASFNQAGTDDSTTHLNQIKKSAEMLCKDDSCTENLRAEFENVGGRIWCCALTLEILNLFGIEGGNIAPSMLQIPDVNFVLHNFI